jgi:hypothetical protein
VELYEGDPSPSEAAEHLAHIMGGVLPSDHAYWLLRRAHWTFRIVRHLDMEDLELSLDLLKTARAALREIALVWLERRGCECCIALRNKLQNSEVR